MVSLDPSPRGAVDRRYAEASADPGFGEIMQDHAIGTEDDLADLIELDGRTRIELGRPVDLGRYLGAVPNLEACTVALDAAIDVTLRSLSLGRRPDSDAVGTLILSYPHLERAIRDAAVLGRSMLTTSEVYRGFAADLPAEFPADFGPTMADARARYALLELLGVGASGAVYRAADRQLSDADRPALVAIKLMRFRERSPWARQCFVEEAAKARRIAHANVARVLDRGVTGDDTDYIVYEFVDGGDLHSWFDACPGPLPERQAAALAAKIARGVHAAHIAGLVHCDLKPGNILMTSTGEPKVTDFGIAVRAGKDGNETLALSPGRAPGSLAFTPPEQFRMEPGSLATPADVYAVGAILYFLLTGLYPNGQTPEEVMGAHDPAKGLSAAASPRSVRPALDRDLDAICRRALSPMPGGRQGSAADLAADLEAWLAHQPIYWTGPSLPHVLRLWSRRRPWAASTAIVSLILIMASIGVATRAWSVASMRGAEARLASSRVSTVQTELGRTLAFYRAMRSNNLSRELLPVVVSLESLQGQTVLGTPDNRTILWTDRIQIVSSIVKDAQKSGRGDDLEVLMWQSAWAFWLVSDAAFDDASPILDDNIARLTARLGADPWIEQMRALAACADVERLRAAGSPPDASPGSPIRRAEGALLHADEVLRGRDAGGPVHRLVLRSLVDLYKPGLLDSPKDSRRFQKRLDAPGG